jgi:hypothetical protein
MSELVTTCRLDDCDHKRKGRSTLCAMHQARLYRYGDTSTVPPRPQIHGMCSTKTYKSWEMMIQRCTNPAHDSYPDYGGRGITVDPRWRDFAAFLEDMGERPEGKTLDRIDPERGYEPGQCRWATQAEQVRNAGPRGGSSQYKGVHWLKRESKWVAAIQVDGTRHHIGTYAEEAEAARAYDAAAVAAWGSFGVYLNFGEAA